MQIQVFCLPTPSRIALRLGPRSSCLGSPADHTRRSVRVLFSIFVTARTVVTDRRDCPGGTRVAGINDGWSSPCPVSQSMNTALRDAQPERDGPIDGPASPRAGR